MNSRIVLVVLILAMLAGFAIWWTYTPTPSEVIVCQRSIPGMQQVGLKIGTAADGSLTVDFGQSQKTEGASPEQIKAFIECLEKTKTVHIVKGINIPAEPLAQVADRWNRDNELKFSLMPGINDQILNNLKIGPAVGSKKDVVRDWCKAAEKCVECRPEDPTDQTQYVEVTLRDSPPVERRQMPGTWPTPPAGKIAPWQLVEPDGKRYFFECKR